MKKTIILSIIGLLGFLSLNGQIQLGISVGADYATMKIKREYLDVSGIRGIPAYHFGIISKYAVKENFSLTADLLLSKKGFTQSNSQIISQMPVISDSTTIFKVSTYNIELPILAEFKFKIEKMNILIGTGPYFAVGLQGKLNLDINSPSTHIDYSEKISWSNHIVYMDNTGEWTAKEYGYSIIKRFDYGTTVRLGIEIKSVVLYAEYKYGLANLFWEYRKHERMNNQSLGLSLICFFTIKK